MPRYRELAGRRIYRCAQCGQIKHVKYVPTSRLCRKCAAKKRGRAQSIPVTLTEMLVITKAVEKRFRKKAEAEIPPTRAEVIGDRISKFQVIFFWVSAYFVATSLFGEPFSGTWWLFVLGWCVGVPYVVMLVIDKILEKPRREREEQITSRIHALAEERRKTLEEQERFYSSPEWVAVRKQVIAEEGHVCAECGKKITHDNGLTVDHKYPRSKYPELALKRENLRVLCRKCNSKKKDQEWLEI